MRVAVLAGGVGGARFVRGLRALDETLQIDVVSNTGDDMWLAGLRICPDLDTVMYTMAGVNDESRGWGQVGESERVSAELTRYGVGLPWFTLGDLDLGTHIARTALLREGLTLTEATQRLSSRWDLGVRLLPATDDEVETHVELVDSARPLLHFQEWWVRHRATLPASRFVQRGLEAAHASPQALAAVRGADIVLIAPSNPVVSVAPILSLPGMREAVREARLVVGVSPIIAGRAVRGMADECLRVIGVETSAAAVGMHYGARSRGGLIDGWLVDSSDADGLSALSEAGIAARALPLLMTDEVAAAAIARAALHLAEAVHPGDSARGARSQP